jgi:flagellar protein FliO/FliZ
MWELLSWLFFFVFIAALIVMGGLLLRGYLATGSVTGSISNTFFGPRPQKRLEITDHANVDGRRRLVLVRRDNVEHLIMIGGPVDIVVETGIGESRTGAARPSGEVVEPPVFSRAPRSLGQAVGEK